MKLTIYLFSLITLILGGVAVALKLQPTLGMSNKTHERRFGLFENRELVGRDDGHGNEAYSVEDKDCNQLFIIPLRNCIIDTRYRNGRLNFREKSTGREGYIDKQGMITFLDKEILTSDRPKSNGQDMPKAVDGQQGRAYGSTAKDNSVSIPPTDVSRIAKSSPFYKEAVKVMSGNLSEDDADKRRVILNYCEIYIGVV